MEIAATYNPVTYILEAMRSLVLHDLETRRHEGSDNVLLRYEVTG